MRAGGGGPAAADTGATVVVADTGATVVVVEAGPGSGVVTAGAIEEVGEEPVFDVLGDVSLEQAATEATRAMSTIRHPAMDRPYR